MERCACELGAGPEAAVLGATKESPQSPRCVDGSTGRSSLLRLP